MADAEMVRVELATLIERLEGGDFSVETSVPIDFVRDVRHVAETLEELRADVEGVVSLLQWIRGMLIDEESYTAIDAKVAEAIERLRGAVQ